MVEAYHIQRQYKTILDVISGERIGYESQLIELEKSAADSKVEAAKLKVSFSFFFFKPIIINTSTIFFLNIYLPAGMRASSGFNPIRPFPFHERSRSFPHRKRNFKKSDTWSMCGSIVLLNRWMAEWIHKRSGVLPWLTECPLRVRIAPNESNEIETRLDVYFTYLYFVKI